ETLKTIDSGAFSGCKALKKAELPKSLTKVGSFAFQNCTSMVSVKTSMLSKGIFGGCLALNSVTLDMSSGTIPAQAFKDCIGLDHISIPEGITGIEEEAFSGCASLAKVDVPASLESGLNGEAFSGCSALSDISIDSASVHYIFESPFVYNKDKSMLAFCLPKYQGAVTIPDTVRKLDDGAFMSCAGLTKAVMPDSVETVGKDAFNGCSGLSDVRLSSKITDLAQSTFKDCTSLKEIELPEDLKTMQRWAFYGCSSLDTMLVPAGFREFKAGACYNMKGLKYVLYAGTADEWKNIKTDKTRPEILYPEITVLYGAKKIGDPEDAPEFTKQPQKAAVKKGSADNKVTFSASVSEPEEGTKYFFVWYKNTEKSESGSTILGSTDDGKSETSWTAELDTSKTGITYYYCRVICVDKDGTAVSRTSDIVPAAVTESGMTGSGTEDDPYQIATAEDLQKIYDITADGNSLDGVYLKMTDDIELPAGWKPIGVTKDGTANISDPDNFRPFSGIFDGAGHTITVPEGGLPLFGYVHGASIKNLNIYGKKIAGYGLVNNLEGKGFSGTSVTIDNVTLKSGSATQKSGLTGANLTTSIYAGCGSNYSAVIRNCTIEKGVTVGYDKDQISIGSIAGRMQGTVENCVSYADVYGKDYVGGIIGSRDNAMGDVAVNNCGFHGTVTASGTQAGGISGGTYTNSTAPNGAGLKITGCECDGTVAAEDKAGGILGADNFTGQRWDNGQSAIKDNRFTGKVSVTKENGYAGAIIGYLKSMNKHDHISGNSCASGCGADKGIGRVDFIDTSCVSHETASGTAYFSTEKDTSGCPSIVGCWWKQEMNRTDDPLGADADKLCKADKSPEEEADEKAASAVSSMIEKLPASDKVTKDDKEAINAARSAYDALTNSQKKLVSADTLKKLTDAEAALKKAEYESAGDNTGDSSSADEKAASAVAAMIDKLPAADKVTKDDKEAINAARSAYDALTDSQKKLVSADTLKKLTDAEAVLKKAEQDDDNDHDDKEEAEKVRVEAVKNSKVKNVKVKSYPDSRKMKISWDAVEHADGYRAAYRIGKGSWKYKYVTGTETTLKNIRKNSVVSVRVQAAAVSVSGERYYGKKSAVKRASQLKTSIKKVRAGRKCAKVYWKNLKKASGYEISWSRSSKFRGQKTVKAAGRKKSAKRISKLAGRKTYYFRIRAYRTADGEKYYGSWSGTAKVRVK
ncbi:MAG: leucine-rich repeat protein, partial [Anaerovoracaceae bacterium]